MRDIEPNSMCILLPIYNSPLHVHGPRFLKAKWRWNWTRCWASHKQISCKRYSSIGIKYPTLCLAADFRLGGVITLGCTTVSHDFATAVALYKSYKWRKNWWSLGFPHIPWMGGLLVLIAGTSGQNCRNTSVITNIDLMFCHDSPFLTTIDHY